MMLNIYYLSLQETTTNVTNSTEPPDNLQFTFNITYLKPEVDDNPRSDVLNVDDDDEEEETDEAVGDNLFSDLYSEEGFLDDADDVVIETSQTSTPATTTTTTTSKLPTSPRHEPENDVFPLNGYLYDSDGGNVRSNVDLTTLLAKLKSERDKTTARLQTSPHTPFLLKSDVSIPETGKSRLRSRPFRKKTSKKITIWRNLKKILQLPLQRQQQRLLPQLRLQLPQLRLLQPQLRLLQPQLRLQQQQPLKPSNQQQQSSKK